MVMTAFPPLRKRRRNERESASSIRHFHEGSNSHRVAEKVDLFGTKVMSLEEMRDVGSHPATRKRRKRVSSRKDVAGEDWQRQTTYWYAKDGEVQFHDSADPVNVRRQRETSRERERGEQEEERPGELDVSLSHESSLDGEIRTRAYTGIPSS